MTRGMVVGVIEGISMDSNNLEFKTKKTKTKIKIGKGGEIMEQEQFRIVLNKEANAGLESYLEMVNTGFDGGKVTKSALANYVFIRLKNLLADSDIKAIQSSCFDDKEALLTLGKSNDELPEAVKKAIREAYGLHDRDKKRPAKTTQDLSTAKNVDNSTAA